MTQDEARECVCVGGEQGQVWREARAPGGRAILGPQPDGVRAKTALRQNMYLEG